MLVLGRGLIFNKAKEIDLSGFWNCILKGYTVSLQAPGLWEGKKRSGGRVAVQADLHWDFSIVCLHVCSAPCQIAAKT